MKWAYLQLKKLGDRKYTFVALFLYSFKIAELEYPATLLKLKHPAVNTTF
jgi:hypothetical protein